MASVPIIAFYQTLLNLLHFPEKTECFDDTISLLRQYPNLFNPVELRNIYAIVRSYCISKINTGNKIFEQKLWELYDSQIHSDAILNEEKEIAPATFKNIIVLGIRLHKIVETEKIIQNYQIHLAANLRQDVVNYCYAKIYFYKKDYLPIVKLLNQMQYDDIFF